MRLILQFRAWRQGHRMHTTGKCTDAFVSAENATVARAHSTSGNILRLTDRPILRTHILPLRCCKISPPTFQLYYHLQWAVALSGTLLQYTLCGQPWQLEQVSDEV